jgi:uncharacterized protein (DUF697 family)
MPLTRVLMLLAMMLVLVGLMYGMVLSNYSAKAMTVEISCLSIGALIFYSAHSIEKKRGGS